MPGQGTKTVRIFCLAVLLAVMCLRVVAYATVDGADPAYLGAWTLTDVAAAPWAPPVNQAGLPERSKLIGQTIVLKPDTIDGPGPFNCAGPRYKFRDVAARKIFAGALDAMSASDRSTDPELTAGRLGFLGPSVKTLETGCELTFHFADHATAEVGVGDTLFTFRKR